MLASANHPIGRRLEVGDLAVSARWPIPVCDHRMSIRNQACIRIEIECAAFDELHHGQSRLPLLVDATATGVSSAMGVPAPRSAKP